MKNWDEVETYVTARYKVTYRSEFMLFFELPDGQSAMIQEAETAGLDYETIRVEVGGFGDEEDSAYQILKAVSRSTNGLFTCEEVAAKLYVRHMVPTLILTGPVLDAFLQWIGAAAADLRSKQASGQLLPQRD